MTSNAPARALGAHRWVLAGLGAVLCVAAPSLARVESWREEGPSAFRKAHHERVVATDAGRVRLGRALAPLGTLGAMRVWDLARGPDGGLFAATGDEGKVFRHAAGVDGSWEVAFDAPDTQALALAVASDGHVFVGTGPTGQVVDLTDPKRPATRPSPSVLYVWDLAADRSGNLYAATGPEGQLWKRAPDGRWSLLVDSRCAHLLCVAVGDDGSVFAGSDGDGLVYEVAPGGKVSIVHDAQQDEVRCLLPMPGGGVFAGTASSSGGGGGRGPGSFPGATTTTDSGSAASRDRETTATQAQAGKPGDDQDRPPETPSRSTPSSGGTASPRPATSGENAVYRIEPDGAVREVFRARALVFSLGLAGDRLLVGTGPEGRLHEVDARGRESAPLARLDSGHVLSILTGPGGEALLGTADPGQVVRVEPGYCKSGTIRSEVKDTKLLSRFGAMTWRAHLPPGTSVRLQARGGNVAEPDSTWSDWSAEQTDPEKASAGIPAGRFVQYQAHLATSDPKATPELVSVTLRYRTINLGPEISRLDVPDLTEQDGATRQTRLTFKWDASDPNDDELVYHVELRKEGWPDWIRLDDEPLTEKSLAWDSTSVPSGVYRIRLLASDERSNNPDDSREVSRESEPFVIDHQAPEVRVRTRDGRANVSIRDQRTRIARAAYAVDGGPWVPVFAADGLFDTLAEDLTIDLKSLGPGPHVLMVQATDAAGNVGSADALIEPR